MKKAIAITMMILTVVFSVSAVDFMIGLEGKNNGFELNASQDENVTLLNMDASVDAKFSLLSDAGFGGYLSAGYWYQENSTITDIATLSKFNHGISADLGLAFKAELSKNWDFILGTGIGLTYGLKSEIINLIYEANVDLNYNIGSAAYIKLGVNYGLHFMQAAQNPVTDEWETTTFIKHKVGVPTIGVGVRF